MKKLFLSHRVLWTIIASVLLTSAATAQVKYKLTRMPDNATYMVSLVSEATWLFPQNVTTTAQVSLRLPNNTHFIAGRITSLVPDTRWIDNSYLEKPTGDANSNYILISQQNVGTKALTFEAGKELPLFTFQNIGTTCFGSVELADNNSEAVKSVVANGLNVGQHISTLGAGGEAYTGNIDGGKVLCQGTTSTLDADAPLSITRGFPIPASTDLTIEWQLATDKLDNLQLIVTNALGETLLSQNLTPSKGLQTTKVDVKSWAEGVCFFRLTSKQGVSKVKSFVVVH